ncbi:MAG: hypothetical protein WBA45_08520, partial [Microthrixaceae bacterium]
VYHIGAGTLSVVDSAQYRPVIPAPGGNGGALSPAANGGVGGPMGNCALIGGCGGNSDGRSAAAGNSGPGGQKGPNGQLFRVWDNGTTTS